jgi:hypothetical protein
MIEGTLVSCPSCGETIDLTVDTSVSEQSYVEDCPVCCRPMEVRVRARPGRVLSVDVDGA